MARDYYEVLGVPRNAPDKEIRAAYRRLARKYHPDVNPGNPAAEARFKEVNEAHEVLSDSEKRRLYDRYGAEWKHAQGGVGATPGAGGPGPFQGRAEQGPAGFEDLLSETGLEDAFERFFGEGGLGRTATRSRRAPPQGEQPVEISLEEAYGGAARLLEVPTGELCRACRGQGRTSGGVCPQCLGHGYLTRRTRVEVAIPPGVDTGSKIRVQPGGQTVVLRVVVRPHSDFHRRGHDLYSEVSLPIYDAVLGGEVVVPTLKGQVALNVPPGTQNGQAFRLAGQGMPHLENPRVKGDLYVMVKVALPEKLTERERDLFRRLKEMRKG
jgi:DnaJ-class molecular chaperone